MKRCWLVLLFVSALTAAPICGSGAASRGASATPTAPASATRTTVLPALTSTPAVTVRSPPAPPATATALPALPAIAPCPTQTPVTPPESATDSARAATEMPIPSSPPTATSTPAPPLDASGSVVAIRGSQLVLASLSGGGERVLTAGPRVCGLPSSPSGGTSFAGAATIDGRVWLYFVEGRGPVDHTPYTPWHVALLRAPLDGGPAEELLRYDVWGGYPQWSASVSPDGLHILYADLDGLYRYDLAPGTSTLLFADVKDCMALPEATGPCHIFELPRWSPDLHRAIAGIGEYEGSEALVFDPMAEHQAITPLGELMKPPSEFGAQVGGRFAHWSPDGSQLCLSEDGFAGGTGGVMSIQDYVFHSRTGGTGDDCAWGDDGPVAFSYARGDYVDGVVFYDAQGHRERDVAIDSGRLQLAGWLPDGSGVVVSWYDGPNEGYHALAVLLDGTTRRLPFEADQVLAVLP